MELSELLTDCLKSHASDLHLSVDMPPLMRVDGELRPLRPTPLNRKLVSQLLFTVMTDSQKRDLETALEVDFAFEIDGLVRFRANIFWQYRGLSGVFRLLPKHILSLDTLHMSQLKNFTQYRSGLVLVTGPSGSGKSTTLAAMVDEINRREHHHILTLEDPIEFIHHAKKSLISQREVHRHTHSFANALRAALREDPNVILVGELRDLETIRLALTAAETGHLVLATVHTASAAKTIARVISIFPADEQATVRVMLSESLRAVVSQLLLKKHAKPGRLAAQEIMVANTAIRNLIRENKVPQMYSVLQTNRDQGMQTLAMHLRQLVEQKLVSVDEAGKYVHGSNATGLPALS